MTTVHRDRSTITADSGPEPLSSRLRRGLPLLVGAVLVLLLLEPLGSLPLKGWVPVLIGLSYVAAGLLSGRQGLLLGPGIVLTAWGVAPMTVTYAGEFPGLFYLCLGAGMLVAALLAQRGWYRITPMSLALPVLFIGGTMWVASFAGRWLTTILALLLAGWALYEMRSRRGQDQPAVQA